MEPVVSVSQPVYNTKVDQNDTVSQQNSYLFYFLLV